MKNKFLSLEWFKNSAERAIENVISKRLETLMEQEEQETQVPGESLFINVKLVNDTLIVVLANGSILTKPSATEEDYNAILNAKSEMDIHAVIMSAQVADERMAREAEVRRVKALQQGIKLLSDLPDFTVEGNTVYLTGTSRSLPQLLVEKFIEIVDRVSHEPSQEVFHVQLNNDEEYLAHKRFFMWCCLNPRAEVANELYRFLTENSFRITKQGFFVALRNVVTLHGSPELVQFVSNTYNKVKAVWKKSPDDYHVILQEDGTYKLINQNDMFIDVTEECDLCEGSGMYYDYDLEEETDCYECDGSGEITYSKKNYTGEDLGTLTSLYLDLPNREENRFTDDWTKTFDIRIGQLVSMPKEDCNWSTQDCAAAGLHFTADQIHYVGCGDQSVLVLINPMKVVGIGTHKGRCYEYLPIMTVPREEATSILHDLAFDTLALDESYAIKELESLEEIAKEGFTVEASKYEFNLPTLSSKELRGIIASLDEMRNEISKRIVTID